MGAVNRALARQQAAAERRQARMQARLKACRTSSDYFTVAYSYFLASSAKAARRGHRRAVLRAKEYVAQALVTAAERLDTNAWDE